jgi:KDO transferase-3
MSKAPKTNEAISFDHCKGIGNGSVFIVASGSSAKDFSFKKYAQYPMITMNGGIAMFKDTGVRPFFYTCSDKSFYSQQPELFNEALRLSQRVALWPDVIDSFQGQLPNETYALKKATKKSMMEWLVPNRDLIRGASRKGFQVRPIGFSKDLSQGYFDARTVAYIALQIAYHTGFEQVFMVGFDMNESVGRFYEGGLDYKSPCGLDSHFETRILPSLKLMSKRVVNDSFKVYNLSPISRIQSDVIPYVSEDMLDGLLKKSTKTPVTTQPELASC